MHVGTTGHLLLAADMGNTSSTVVLLQGSDAKEDSTACVAAKCGAPEAILCQFALYAVPCLMVT